MTGPATGSALSPTIEAICFISIFLSDLYS